MKQPINPFSRFQALVYIPLLLGLILLFIFSETLVHLLTQTWWFDAIGFTEVFWTQISWRILIWIGVFVVYALFLWGQYGLAMRLTRDRPIRYFNDFRLRPYINQLPRYIAAAVILLLALFAATESSASWTIVLKYLNPSEFGVQDPIFQQDIGFYLFQLPLFEMLQIGVLGLLFWGLIIALAVYGIKGEIRPERGWKYFLTGKVKTHLCLLLAAMAVAIAIGFWLERYELLYSPSGVVFGAGYTDVNARLQAYWLMGCVTLAVAGLFILSLWRSGFSLPIIGIFAYIAILLVFNIAYPWFQQQVIVAPNELEKENPYIINNIQFTRQAYGLADVQRESFPAKNQLDRQDLQDNASTLRNIRLWDYRPLQNTYRQLQEIRSYYSFEGVDVDRYSLEGDYRQVMLSAREFDFRRLPNVAKNWVNQRLKYTHGHGVVMSPVNRVTPNGLPEFFIKDIPPSSQVDLTVEQPGIYYGENTTDYVFTGTSTPEFDYPVSADDNAVTNYDGKGGVPIGSFWRRLAYTYQLGSFKILLSNYFTDTSRVHYHREIRDRVTQIAPFLQYDSDPYITVVNGRLKWIIDAYTVSNRYPYSTPLRYSKAVDQSLVEEKPDWSVTPIANPDATIRQVARHQINYLRDSVKVVVDAYDGDVQFFVIDENDPVLATYRKIFPTLFKPSNAIPPEIRAHFRYPRDFFTIQAQMYQAYHMVNPEVFYNREDLWRFPFQNYEGNEVLMQPYYAIMRLPGESKEEFISILPFTPNKKDNMVAWMTARSDGDGYGKLLLYEFPKQELVYGPRQIEARIDQTPNISQQLTLWSQEGSRVIRGDLLVIPIEQSLLYVEPIYLRAERGELPQLKRVIVAYGDQTVMTETLEKSLNAIFGEGQALDTQSPAQLTRESAEQPETSLPNTLSPLVKSALETYQEGQTALRQGDWERYGQTQQELGRLLQRLNEQAEEAN
ncbi:MAG: UPF0182 family protein [Leptolyngbyaceae cyanobacterium MO_188.B28]|nr:UPF0182 family protein [Leptolyngbyaceae cyanobacterium MO_188.B28]